MDSTSLLPGRTTVPGRSVGRRSVVPVNAGRRRTAAGRIRVVAARRAGGRAARRLRRGTERTKGGRMAPRVERDDLTAKTSTRPPPVGLGKTRNPTSAFVPQRIPPCMVENKAYFQAFISERTNMRPPVR